MTALELGGRTVSISNASKTFFPDDDITKGDVVDYYRRIAPWMLPWLRDHPVVMHRFPDGIHHEGFFAKQAPEGLPDWVERTTVRHGKDATTDYVVCQDAATLVVLANLGCLVPHVLLSRVGEPDRPDQIVFDLDPSGDFDDAAVEQVRLVAGVVHDCLDDVGAASFVKSSGSRGVHIHVPIHGCPGFDESRHLARQLARRVAHAYPDTVTLAQRKADRGDRLYLDVLRNGYGQHAVAAYALRALPTAPVAVPLDWSEVADARFHPRRLTMRTVFRRLAQKQDPWAEFDDRRVSFDHLQRCVRAQT
jgi:bifunctional non-homologous end joining protein LigD